MEVAIPEEMKRNLKKAGIIAVLIIDNPDMAVPLAETLLENGVNTIELTLRTETALESLRRIRREVPEIMAGAGTVLSPAQVVEVNSAGAAFGVAPGFNRRVVEKAASEKFPFSPGISTPSELEGAVENGCNVLKFFHAEAMGGVKYLKGINAPYSFLNLSYIPLGGLKPDNIHEYLEMEEVLALGGSWIAPRPLIQAEDWKTIGKNAAEAYRILREVRG
ncbi:MAG: bifunctional 4-hydroxy-2-oxoglutarate aldolase/2-dehydro-3-deoxy-phosphogluconate aldolase [Spirochaetales bacterium]|nr:bifunctional 4-hydroxy-2-oxoglutarate aldolase/2-dehydro-3-deoxy-phosphogluconate aldolase [Spirochaetales bacterium]